MRSLRSWAVVAKTLAFLGLGALFLSFLALHDIFHGEENARLEWGILVVTLFVVLLLIAAAFILTGLTFKSFRGQASARIWATVSAALGIAGLVFLALSTLALQGIYRGEDGGPPEWTLLRLAFLAVVVLIVAIFISTGLLSKYFRDKDDGKKQGNTGNG